MDNLTEYGYTKDSKVYLKAYMDFPERQIGVVREDEQTSLHYFINRFSLASSKVQILKESVASSVNKGSYLMKLIHMRAYLSKFDGLGDFPSLFKILDDLEEEISVYIGQNRQKNQEIKTALLAETLELQHSTDWNETTRILKEIKLKWIKTGSAPKDDEKQLNEQFDAAFDYFFQRRKDHIEELNRVFRERFEQCKDIIDEVRRLTYEQPKDGVQKIKALQAEWRTIGNVNKKFARPLYKEFSGEVTKFFARRRTLSIIPDVSELEPIEQKLKYCEAVEKVLEKDAELPIEAVKEIQNRWKNLGKVNHNLDREYNTRFKIACNEIFEAYFLDQTVRWKNKDFDEKTRFEQLKIKIRFLKETIKQDETELSLLNEKTLYKKDDPQLNLQKVNQINKLKTKNRILRKLQDLLLANY